MKTFIARQPIFDTKNDVIGYELLFRKNVKNQANIIDDSSATLKVIKDVIINFGIREITNNKRFFVKFTTKLILDNVPELFKSEQLVIELVVNEYDEFLFEKLKEYKEKGFLIALDQFRYDSSLDAFIEIADMIKIDFLANSKNEIIKIINEIKNYKKVLIAEKVEDDSGLSFAKSMGCSMFQGFFFQKPIMLETSEIVSIPAIYFQLLKELNQKEIDYGRLASLIERDSTMTLALLKLINSVVYYSQQKVTSVKSALVRLGVNESRKIIMINMLKNIKNNNSPNELIKMSLRRGKQAELLAPYYQLNDRKDELFLVGLLSLINIIMRRQMSTILADVPLKEDVLNALLGVDNALSQVLDVVILLEMAAYDEVVEKVGRYGITIGDLNRIYSEAIIWADDIE